ncbi:DMT family transporter [Litoreibacter roseus]|uniref:Permease n=1 Tax=Litoreibacter roseus TaxID=2601869 RepID=A0A6N6JC41_9RHOB|nr:DMT family transporter [Litoreibacter roseus]GFE63735.1 permease [Litoreibacter roseus]
MTQRAQGRSDRTGQGIVIILASVLTMAFADAVIKHVSTDLSVWQIFVCRSLIAIPVLIGALRVTGRRFAMHAPIWVVLRSGLLVLSWIAFYTSLSVLDLSVAAVAIYTNPILTALMSAELIKEPVGALRWAGVALGFVGVVAILRPGTEAFSWITLLPLLAAALYSLSMVLTRSKCQDETPMVLALSLHSAFLITGLIATLGLIVLGLPTAVQDIFPFVLGGWSGMTPTTWGLMAGLGILSALYFMGVARAYQIAPPAIIGTFDYAYLISAALWGYLFFSETPGPLTILGMILITCAGLLVAAPSPKQSARTAQTAR